MDDLIYKSQVIDAIMGQPPEPHYPSWYVEQIKALQPVEPKRGYWIESHEHIYVGNGVKEWTSWYCSECDAPNDKPTDFCPNCGADMKGGKDGTN